MYYIYVLYICYYKQSLFSIRKFLIFIKTPLIDVHPKVGQECKTFGVHIILLSLLKKDLLTQSFFDICKQNCSVKLEDISENKKNAEKNG